MIKYYEVTVTFEEVEDDGVRIKKQRYLTDALSVSEAEARVVAEVAPYACSPIAVVSVTATKYKEVIRTPDDEHWYKCTYNIVTLDEKKGRELRKPMQVLIGADTVDAAMKKMYEEINKSVCDMELTGVVQTKIVDFFLYGRKEVLDGR